MTRDEIYRQLERAFRQYCGVQPSVTRSLVPETLLAGKLYEAHVLSLVVQKLKTCEGYTLILAGGSELQLKSAPGPINRSYPRIELRRSDKCVAELWTDVEFLSPGSGVKSRISGLDGSEPADLCQDVVGEVL